MTLNTYWLIAFLKSLHQIMYMNCHFMSSSSNLEPYKVQLSQEVKDSWNKSIFYRDYSLVSWMKKSQIFIPWLNWRAGSVSEQYFQAQCLLCSRCSSKNSLNLMNDDLTLSNLNLDILASVCFTTGFKQIITTTWWGDTMNPVLQRRKLRFIKVPGFASLQ